MKTTNNAKNSSEHLQPQLDRLKKRSEFLVVAKGKSSSRKAFKIQTIKRNTEQSFQTDPSSIRVGFTVTKKTGNSPERNRIKRRLRAAWQIVAPICARAGYDYVLIGRRQALWIKFKELTADLESAIRQVSNQHDESIQNSKHITPTPIGSNIQ